jgi:hypothetical protein
MLVEQGMPQEQAVQAIQSVAQQMQGQPQEQMMQDGGLVGDPPPGILGEANDAGYAPYNPPGYNLRKGSTYQEDPENWIYWKKDDKVYRKDLFDGSYSELRPPTKDDLKFLEDFSKWANSSEAKSEEVQKKYNKEIKPLLNSLDRPIRPASNPRDKAVEQMIADGSFCDDCTYRYSAYDEFDFKKVPIPEDYPEVSVLEDSEVQKSKPGYKYRYHQERNPFTSQYEVMSPTQHRMLEREAYKLRNQGIKPTIDNMPIIENRELLDVVTRKPVGTRPWSGKIGVGWTEDDVINEKNKDFYKSDTSEEERTQYKLGGDAQSQDQQIQQLIMMYAEISGEDPQSLMEMLSQAQPEEQQQMLQQMAQEVQAAQASSQQAGPETMMQLGGQAGSQEEEIQQLIMAYAQISGQLPEEIMQQLQQISPEEQQSALQEMAMAVQDAQQGQMQVPNQAKKGMEILTELGYNSLSEYIQDQVADDAVKKMLNGGLTKKDFKSITKDLIKEYKGGGELDASSSESFIANLSGAVKNWAATNYNVGEIKRNFNLMKDSFLVDDEKKNLDQARRGKELPKAVDGVVTGAVKESELNDNHDGKDEDGSSIYSAEYIAKQKEAGLKYDSKSKTFIDPAKVNTIGSRKAKPEVFSFTKTPTVKAAGDASLFTEQQAFKNFDPKTQKIQQTAFATNIFGNKITDVDKSNAKLEKWAGKGKWDKMNRRMGMNYQVVDKPVEDDDKPVEDDVTNTNESTIAQPPAFIEPDMSRGEKRMQRFEDRFDKRIARKESQFRPGLRNRLLQNFPIDQPLNTKQQGGELNYNDKLIWDFKNNRYIGNPTLPKALGGIDVGSKNKLSVNWANLADETVTGMNKANTFLEQIRTYDPKRELAGRQNFASVNDGGDRGLYAATLRGKFKPDDMGAPIRSGTGSDPRAFGIQSNNYLSGALNTGDQWVKKGGTVESDDDFVKRMRGLGIKIKLK